MFRRVCLAIACACAVRAVAGTASAQTIAPPSSAPLPSLERPASYPGPSLTLEDAVELALTQNAALIAMKRDVDVARHRPAQSRFLAPPTLNAQIWQWPIDSVSPRDTNMYMLTVEQGIPGRGKRDLRVTVAQRDAEMAENEVAVIALKTVGDLTHAYVTLFAARKAAEWYAESATVLRQLADAAETGYAAGRLPQHDVLTPVAELSRLYDEALTTREQADLAAGDLNVLMGRAVDEPIGPLVDPVGSSSLPPLSALLSLALDRQPEIQSARLAVERAKADLALTRSDARPDFTVSGGYMLTPRGTDAWTGGVGITWPNAPWSRGRLAARIAESASAVTAAEARLQAVESQTRLSIQQAYVKATTAERRSALLQTTIIPQLQQALDASRIGYEADRLDVSAVLEDQRSLIAGQLDYLHVLTDRADAQADLERAVGIRLDEPATGLASGDVR